MSIIDDAVALALHKASLIPEELTGLTILATMCLQRLQLLCET